MCVFLFECAMKFIGYCKIHFPLSTARDSKLGSQIQILHGKPIKIKGGSMFILYSVLVCVCTHKREEGSRSYQYFMTGSNLATGSTQP